MVKGGTSMNQIKTGKSMPDASIMLDLCKILGITVNELLSGEKVNTEHLEKKADGLKKKGRK